MASAERRVWQFNWQTPCRIGRTCVAAAIETSFDRCSSFRVRRPLFGDEPRVAGVRVTADYPGPSVQAAQSDVAGFPLALPAFSGNRHSPGHWRGPNASDVRTSASAAAPQHARSRAAQAPIEIADDQHRPHALEHPASLDVTAYDPRFCQTDTWLAFRPGSNDPTFRVFREARSPKSELSDVRLSRHASVDRRCMAAFRQRQEHPRPQSCHRSGDRNGRVGRPERSGRGPGGGRARIRALAQDLGL